MNNALITINGWRVADEPEVGRTGRAYVVWRDEEPARQFVLKLWRDDQPKLEKSANAKEAERLKTTKTPRRMPKLIETGEWNGWPFFVMEKIEGVDYPIPDKEYRAFCVEAFTALGELHQAGLLHCDLTPAHLGWKNGKIAFIDFDSAHTFAEATKNRDSIGTDPYIAPEVASRGKLSVQSDLFALATILIERCPKKLRDCFEPVLRECLRPDPTERPGSAAEFAERLRACRPPHHRFKAAAKWAARAASAIVLGIVVLALTSRLYRRTRMTSEELALAHAEASGIAAERYYYGKGVKRNLELSRKHAEAAARLGDTRGKNILKMLESKQSKPLRQRGESDKHLQGGN